jgi:hypothetical protein
VDRIPKKNPAIIWKNVQGETVLLNPISGKYYGLNRVGCAFWEKADGTRSLSEIAGLLHEEFNADRERILNDLEDLMKTLADSGLVTLS